MSQISNKQLCFYGMAWCLSKNRKKKYSNMWKNVWNANSCMIFLWLQASLRCPNARSEGRSYLSTQMLQVMTIIQTLPRESAHTRKLFFWDLCWWQTDACVLFSVPLHAGTKRVSLMHFQRFHLHFAQSQRFTPQRYGGNGNFSTLKTLIIS